MDIKRLNIIDEICTDVVHIFDQLGPLGFRKGKKVDFLPLKLLRGGGVRA